MLFKKRNKNKIRLYGYCALFTIIATSAIWYYLQLPQPLHWTLAIPWSLSAMFFILWRWSKYVGPVNKSGEQKSKIKRYV